VKNLNEIVVSRVASKSNALTFRAQKAGFTVYV